MSKATQMARVSAKGGFHLLWGLVLSTVISAVGTIIIAGLLGAEDYGLYMSALTAPSLIATFRDWGINTAMVKYSAQYHIENNTAKIRSIFISGLVFTTILGIILSVVSFFLSDFLAAVFSRPTIAPLIQIASLIILTGAFVNVATAAFTGIEKMHLNSIMLIVQSIAKTGLVIALVALGLGTGGAVWGSTAALMLAGLVGVLLMYTMYKSLPKPINGALNLLGTTKTMLKYGLPVSIGAILAAILAQFYSTLMLIYVTDNAAVGSYTLAQNFVVLITFFATPVTTMLFPAFSKLDAEKDREALKSVFQFSVKYAALIVVPVTVMVMALSQPAIGTLFQNEFVLAPLFLALLAATYLFSALGNLSTGNLLNGQGYTQFNMKIALLTVAIGFPLSFILISRFGIIGLIVTSLTAGIPGLFLSLRFIKKKFGVSVDWLSSARILFSSAFAGILTYLLISLLPFSNPVQLIVGVISFAALFVISAVLTRTISHADLNNIRDIVNSLGPLRKPIGIFISLVEKLIGILSV